MTEPCNEYLDHAWDIMKSMQNPSPLETGEDVSDPVTCDFCQDASFITLDDGNFVCLKCGTLVDRFIDASAEWRSYANDDHKGADMTRCGLPSNDLLPESSLGASIGFAIKESYDMRMVRKYHMWNSMSYKERSLYNVFDTLTTCAVSNGISKSIIDEAKVLYKKLYESKVSRGENRCGLIASSIYMSCKHNRVPRSAKEIAQIFNLKLTTMTKGCKKYQEIMMTMENNCMTPEDFIHRFCSRMNIDVQKREMCMIVSKRIADLGIACENTPPSIAAATIYLCNMVFDWGICKKELSEACQISLVTVSKCYKRLSSFNDVIFSDEFISHGTMPKSSL